MKCLLIIFLFPLQVFAQNISGVWTGYMYNDSTKSNFQFELAISGFNDKPKGYSRTVFIIDSVKNVGLKSVKIKEKEGHYYIVDEKLIYNNYTEPPAKGVKQFSLLTLSENDSAEVLSGIWKTNPTKIYKQLTGTIFLEKKRNVKPEQTLIVAKLVQLGLSNKLSFLPLYFSTNNLVAININPIKPVKATPEK